MILSEIGSGSGEGDGGVGGRVEVLLVELTLVGDPSEEERGRAGRRRGREKVSELSRLAW